MFPHPLKNLNSEMGTSPRPSEISWSSLVLLSVTRIISLYHLQFLRTLGIADLENHSSLKGRLPEDLLISVTNEETCSLPKEAACFAFMEKVL